MDLTQEEALYKLAKIAETQAKTMQNMVTAIGMIRVRLEAIEKVLQVKSEDM